MFPCYRAVPYCMPRSFLPYGAAVSLQQLFQFAVFYFITPFLSALIITRIFTYVNILITCHYVFLSLLCKQAGQCNRCPACHCGSMSRFSRSPLSILSAALMISSSSSSVAVMIIIRAMPRLIMYPLVVSFVFPSAALRFMPCLSPFSFLFYFLSLSYSVRVRICKQQI